MFAYVNHVRHFSGVNLANLYLFSLKFAFDCKNTRTVEWLRISQIIDCQNLCEIWNAIYTKLIREKS